MTRRRIALFLLSAWMLLLEMALVRWIGTEMRIFAYLQNGVLVAAFLGIGLGSRQARQPLAVLPGAIALLLMVVVIADPLHLHVPELVSAWLADFEDQQIWMSRHYHAGPFWLRLGIAAIISASVLLGVVVAFRAAGQLLGRWLDEDSRPIAAYSVNVAGSLAGIAAFDAMALLRLPPPVWFVLAAAGYVAMSFASPERRGARIAGAAAAIATPVLISLMALGGPPTVWSPYQKLSVVDYAHDGVHCARSIEVNDDYYQLVLELDPAQQRAHPEIFPPAEVGWTQYQIPFAAIGPRHHALVVGAGTGNDVDATLLAGVDHVDAVEIDPAIADLGRRLHPDQPYASERVSLHVDDARAWFRRDPQRYDLIWFGLLDSHTTSSAYTNIRLDHFVYTREALAEARGLLAPGGVMVMYFEAETDWIAERLYRLFRDTFASEPVLMKVQPSTPCLGLGGLLLIGGDDGTMQPIRAAVSADARLSAMVRPPPDDHGVEIPTDDWPYLYLRARGIPHFQLLIGALALLIGLRLRKQLFRPGEPTDAPMLLLGAGFMLVEVSAVSRAALLYGTTWTVNAYVVAAILVMVLLSNLVAARRPLSMRVSVAALLAALMLLVLSPMSRIAALEPAARVLVGASFLALPVFFSGLVFVGAWARRERRDLALGSNLVGALLGGVASLLSMAVGLRALLLLAIAVYAVAGWLLLREGPARPAAEAAA